MFSSHLYTPDWLLQCKALMLAKGSSCIQQTVVCILKSPERACIQHVYMCAAAGLVLLSGWYLTGLSREVAIQDSQLHPRAEGLTAM